MKYAILLAIVFVSSAMANENDSSFSRVWEIQEDLHSRFEGLETYKDVMAEIAKDPIDYEKVEKNLATLSHSVVDNSPTIETMKVHAESNLSGWMHRLISENFSPAASVLPLWFEVGVDADFAENHSQVLPVSGLNFSLGVSNGLGFRGLLTGSYVDSLTLDLGADLDAIGFLKMAVHEELLVQSCENPNAEDLDQFNAVFVVACSIVEDLKTADDFASLLKTIAPKVDDLKEKVDALVDQYGQDLAGRGSFLVNWATSHDFEVEACDGLFSGVLGCEPSFTVDVSAGVIISGLEIDFKLTEEKVEVEMSASSAGRATDFAGDRKEIIAWIYVIFKVIEVMNENELAALGEEFAEVLEDTKSQIEERLSKPRNDPNFLFPNLK